MSKNTEIKELESLIGSLLDGSVKDNVEANKIRRESIVELVDLCNKIVLIAESNLNESGAADGLPEMELIFLNQKHGVITNMITEVKQALSPFGRKRSAGK